MEEKFCLLFSGHHPGCLFVYLSLVTGRLERDGHISKWIIEEWGQLALVVIKMGEELLTRHTHSQGFSVASMPMPWNYICIFQYWVFIMSQVPYLTQGNNGSVRQFSIAVTNTGEKQIQGEKIDLGSWVQFIGVWPCHCGSVVRQIILTAGGETR